ncbi:hypothetical protein FQN57_001556 [Myotisia sp. PD_48]|nr:hypothetical protein FQN57_001556 [Myotisia sp. PD_48]
MASTAATRPPRVYLYRHGETPWTINGRHTGITEVELTDYGREQVQASGKLVVGAGKLIDPSNLARVFISPRKRANQTYELAFNEHDKTLLQDTGRVSQTEKLAEWDYGLYEGLYLHEIYKLRQEHGLSREWADWNIWHDGCEGGESPQQITDRMDSLIEEIRQIHDPRLRGGEGAEMPADVVLFAHGHTLRAFVKRWLNLPMDSPVVMALEPGGVGAASYDHGAPAILVGLGFPASSIKSN